MRRLRRLRAERPRTPPPDTAPWISDNPDGHAPQGNLRGAVLYHPDAKLGAAAPLPGAEVADRPTSPAQPPVPVHSPRGDDIVHKRAFVSGVTWGFDIVRALDADDPALLLLALQQPGVDPTARVDQDGYGGYLFSAWAHRLAGDTVLHLALRWKKEKALFGLHPLGLTGFFDQTLEVGDAAGQTVEELIRKKYRSSSSEMWERGRDLETAEREKATRRKADKAKLRREKGYNALLTVFRRANEESRLEARALHADEEADRLVKCFRIVAPPDCVFYENRHDERSKAKLNLIAAAGVKSKTKMKDQRTLKRDRDVKFPLDLDSIDNEALRIVLARVRDNHPPIQRISANHELRYSGPIGPHGGCALGAVLVSKFAKVLTHISLPNHRLTSAGAIAIAKGLVCNDTVTYLDLRSNALCDEAAEALANMLTSNRTLSTLSLEANRISDRGAKAFALRLVKNNGLKRLSLMNNSAITAHGRELLANASQARFVRTRTRMIINCTDHQPAHKVRPDLRSSSKTSTLTEHGDASVSVESSRVSFAADTHKLEDGSLGGSRKSDEESWGH